MSATTEDATPPPSETGSGPPPRHTSDIVLFRRLAVATTLLLTVYLLVAYGVVPSLWKRHARRHPALDEGSPRFTQTTLGTPGDPLNFALVGSEDDVARAFLSASWHPADPVTLRSSLRIAKSTVFHRPYDDAPVSPLVLFGRKQDLAYEQEVGKDARVRHHVRFWRAPQADDQERAFWFGAATFDRKVGLSHTTGQVTHHIAPDLDIERDKLLEDLQNAGFVEAVDWIDPFQERRQGRNGGGDFYFTDGRLPVLILKAGPGSGG
jgi:hypothetical protein